LKIASHLHLDYGEKLQANVRYKQMRHICSLLSDKCQNFFVK